MKKGLKITIGILAGLTVVAAAGGITYAANEHVRDYVNNRIENIVNDDAEDVTGVKVENVLKLSDDAQKKEGVQKSKDEAPVFHFQFQLKDLPANYTGDGLLVTKITSGDGTKAFFTYDGSSNTYEAITHGGDKTLTFTHNAFKKDGEKATYTLMTYWVDHPSIYVNTRVTFKADLPEETKSETPVNSSVESEANA